MREIGSEFWLDNVPIEHEEEALSWLNIGKDHVLLFSGRTAIDYVLEDIPNQVKSVYMPSYCCSSMLQSFIDRNIHIDFYDVICDKEGLRYMIDYEKTCDVFFATSYFGFSSTVMDSIIELFNNKGTIVIEDITHRFLSDQSYCNKAHYNIASLRKWFAIPSGGLAVNQNGIFSNHNLRSPSKPLIDIKINAMTKKGNYIRKYNYKNLTKGVYKKDFLDMFSEFNKGLKFNYKGIKIDSLSIELLSKLDIETVKKKRIDNASFIYEALESQKFVKPLIDKPDFVKDCPLFIPIRIKSHMRESLRSYLMVNDIYCPIHWPVSNLHYLNDKTNKIYEEELSLVCDQRYSVNDMMRIVDIIERFWSEL